jgi:hypothetical protein
VTGLDNYGLSASIRALENIASIGSASETDKKFEGGFYEKEEAWNGAWRNDLAVMEAEGAFNARYGLSGRMRKYA